MRFLFSKKWKFFFVFVFLGGLYITYPYMTLWSISKAMQTHDTKQLLTYLDWQAIKTNLQTDLAHSIQNAPTPNDELPDFGNSFATTAISNAVDIHLTPEALTQFINQIKEDSSQRHSSVMGTLLQSFMDTHIHFTSLTSLQAKVIIPGEQKEDPIQMTMQLQHWKWKVTSFKFSAQRTFQFFQQSDL